MAVYRLRFFFDYGAGVCFWAADEATRQQFNYPVETDQLPLSSGLQATVEQLIMDYDQSLNWNDPGGPSLWTQDEWQRFDKRVEQMLEAVRAELAEQFEIVDEYYRMSRA
ncbi:MAG: hypothetical protein M3R24_33175 [Chloroflexota bacterium]|nr:hypothetical protein [Chloroflexota bacterium]